MDVSVIIVNYNTQQLTQQCLDSIFAKTSELEFEVILVDNGSTDGSRELFSTDERITYIYSEENLGFGKANNLGAQNAQGKYLFFLNSDTYLVNNAIYLLWMQMEEASQDMSSGMVACAGCMLTDEDGQVIHSYAKFPTMCESFRKDILHPILWKLRVIPQIHTTSNYAVNEAEESYFDVDYVTGADLMVRKEVADHVGLFDPDFFMYFEETEMQHRYMKAGFRRIICHTPQIVHLEGKSGGKSSPEKSTIVLKSEMLYYKKTSSSSVYYVFSFFFKMAYVMAYILSFPFINGSIGSKMHHLREVIKDS